MQTNKEMMMGIAATTMDEVRKLLKFNEPLWVKDISRRYVLDHYHYVTFFPKPFLERFEGMFESSKVEGLVRMPARQLVDVFMDMDKWAEFFPTTVTGAKVVQELNSGTTYTRDECLKLIFAKTHILSHLVEARNRFFIRFCRKISEGVWVIADATHESFFNIHNVSPTWCWTLPSGCLIQDISNGLSKVTWMEHSKFKEHITTHPLYEDYVNRGSAYGADRWLHTLQRSAERFTYMLIPHPPNQTLGGNNICGLSFEGQKIIMRFSQRMIKKFCETLAINSSTTFPNVSHSDDSGVQISVHKRVPGQSISCTAMESFWVAKPFETVFNFLMNMEPRHEWDVLSRGKALKAIVHIPWGTHPANCISLLQPLVPDSIDRNVALLQETYIGPLGCLMIYQSVDLNDLNLTINANQDFMPNVDIRPSGFMISRDGFFGTASPNSSNTSIVGANCSVITMVYQILVGNLSNTTDDDSILMIPRKVIRNSSQRIKKALGCDDLDP